MSFLYTHPALLLPMCPVCSDHPDSHALYRRRLLCKRHIRLGIVLTTFSITAAFKTNQELIESVTRPLRRPGAILVILHTLLIRIELHKVGFIFRKISFNPYFLSLWNLNLNFRAQLCKSTCIFNKLPRNHGFVIKALSGNRLYFLSFVY